MLQLLASITRNKWFDYYHFPQLHYYYYYYYEVPDNGFCSSDR